MAVMLYDKIQQVLEHTIFCSQSVSHANHQSPFLKQLSISTFTGETSRSNILIKYLVE